MQSQSQFSVLLTETETETKNERYLHPHSFLQTSLSLLRLPFFNFPKEERRNGSGFG